MTTLQQRPALSAEEGSLKRLRALYTVNEQLRQVVGRGLNIDSALPEVLSSVMEELEAYSGSIIVVDEQLEVQHNWLISETESDEESSGFLRQVIEEGLFGWSLRNQLPALVQDTREDVRWLPNPGHKTSSEPSSAICVPLIIRSRSIGAITMTRPGKGQFLMEDVDLLTAIASQTAATIESARLYEESQRRTEELDKMREDLTAMLVHDLQSPLSNILSSLELLRLEIPQDENQEVESILEIAIRSSRRLQDLIRSLLDISHLEAGHPITNLNEFALPPVIREAMHLVGPVLEHRRVRFEENFSEPLPSAYGDEEMIGRVLINLLDNSARHSPDDGIISLYIGDMATDGSLLVSISDQGPGVAPEYREAIFQKYERGENSDSDSTKGFGLGLAFCRMAIEAHGGRIWIEDAPGGGARFSFTLPAAS